MRTSSRIETWRRKVEDQKMRKIALNLAINNVLGIPTTPVCPPHPKYFIGQTVTHKYSSFPLLKITSQVFLYNSWGYECVAESTNTMMGTFDELNLED